MAADENVGPAVYTILFPSSGPCTKGVDSIVSPLSISMSSDLLSSSFGGGGIGISSGFGSSGGGGGGGNGIT